MGSTPLLLERIRDEPSADRGTQDLPFIIRRIQLPKYEGVAVGGRIVL